MNFLIIAVLLILLVNLVTGTTENNEANENTGENEVYHPAEFQIR